MTYQEIQNQIQDLLSRCHHALEKHLDETEITHSEFKPRREIVAFQITTKPLCPIAGIGANFCISVKFGYEDGREGSNIYTPVHDLQHLNGKKALILAKFYIQSGNSGTISEKRRRESSLQKACNLAAQNMGYHESPVEIGKDNAMLKIFNIEDLDGFVTELDSCTDQVRSMSFLDAFL